MLYLLIACLMFDLAGDSVYQAGPDPIPTGEENQEDGSSEGLDTPLMEISDVEYSQSEGSTETSVISVEVSSDRIDVTHTNVELACDMSPYEPELIVEDRQITVEYMPLGDARDCVNDVRFTLFIALDLEEGTYTLRLMEDETEFEYE